MCPADALIQPVWGAPTALSPPAAPPSRAETLIVGGGITGVALLAELVARGVDARLLERDHVGSGATGRNAGFLLAGVADNYADAVRRHGRAVAAEVWRFTLDNHAMVAGSEAARTAGHSRGGSCTIALDDAEAAALEESRELLSEDGFAAALADPPPGSRCVLVNPDDGEIDPLALVSAMAAPLAGRVHERCAAVHVTDGSNCAVVQLSDGSALEASWVVLACNAWISDLLPGAPILPVRAQMLAAPGPPGLIERPAYAEHGHRYWRQRSDGTVLVGGFRNRALAEEVGYDLTPTPTVQAHLDEQRLALGALSAATHRWCGTMGFSPDGLPLAGRMPGSQRVLICGGYTGHGMGFAMMAARNLADHLVLSASLPAWLNAGRARQPVGESG